MVTFLQGDQKNRFRNSKCLPLYKSNEITSVKCENQLFQNSRNYSNPYGKQGESIQEKCLHLGKNRELCVILTNSSSKSQFPIPSLVGALKMTIWILLQVQEEAELTSFAKNSMYLYY